MDNEYFMDQAIALAREAALEGEVPVGAVVVLGDKIVGTGRNRREKSKNALAHAEIEAINIACKKLGSWRLDGCDLYVTLEPCPMCAGAIINARIKTLIYGAYDSSYGSIDSVINICDQPYPHHPRIYGGIYEDECSRLIVEFFENLRDQ